MVWLTAYPCSFYFSDHNSFCSIWAKLIEQNNEKARKPGTSMVAIWCLYLTDYAAMRFSLFRKQRRCLCVLCWTAELWEKYPYQSLPVPKQSETQGISQTHWLEYMYATPRLLFSSHCFVLLIAWGPQTFGGFGVHLRQKAVKLWSWAQGLGAHLGGGRESRVCGGDLKRRSNVLDC
jgi:hypothetical protein